MTGQRPNDLTIRPIAGLDDLVLFSRLSYVLDEELAGDLEAGRRRPGWMWMALRADRLLARAAWWGRPGDPTPLILDVFDIDDDALDPNRVAVGARLLTTAMTTIICVGAHPPDYVRFVPPAWRDDDTSRQVVEDRMNAARQTGARLLVERLRLEWRPETPIPEPTRRLAFRPIRDQEEIIALMTLVMDGTLDAHSREDLTRLSPRQAAVKHYEDELAQYASPREWWRIATRPDGEPVGFVIPARNDYNAIIAYVGVVPAHRGNGFVDEILAEGSRVLAAQEVPRIRAATDLGNVPMARAFQRAGYVTFEHRIDMTWR